MKKTAIRVGFMYCLIFILLGILVTAVDRSDASSECLSDGDCPADRHFCRQESADQRWTCFATLAQVGQFCVDPDDCNGRRCIDNQCRAAEQDEQEGGIIDAAVEIFQEAIARILAAILPGGSDLKVEQFLDLAQLKKASAVVIVKSDDKLILAKRENPAIDRAAISTIGYQHIDIDVCQKIDKNIAVQDRELVKCRRDLGTNSNFVKTATSNTKLWHQLVSLIQLR